MAAGNPLQNKGSRKKAKKGRSTPYAMPHARHSCSPLRLTFSRVSGILQLEGSIKAAIATAIAETRSMRLC